ASPPALPRRRPRRPECRPRPTAGAPLRHPPRAGRAAPGVARAADDHRAPGADAQAQRGDVGGADARVQRGPRVLVDRRAHHVRRAAADDLRLSRPVRESRRAVGGGGWDPARPPAAHLQPPTSHLLLPHRVRRHVAGRRLRGRAGDEAGAGAGGRGGDHGAHGGAVGRRAVAGAQARARGAPPRVDRDRRVAHLRLRRRPLRGGARRDVRGARPRVDAADAPRRGARGGPHRQPAPRGGGHVPADERGGLGDHPDRVLEPGHHAGHDDHRRRGVVDAPARERPRARHLVPAVGGGAAPRGHARAARVEPRDRARRRAALRLRHHRARPQHRHPAHGLRAAGGGDRAPGRPPRRAPQLQPAAGHRDGRDPAGAERERGAPPVARADALGRDHRHRVHAPDRRARPRRGADGWVVGLPGRRARPRRRAGDPGDVVLDRARGDEPGAGVGRAAGALGAGRGHDPRRGGAGAVGAPAAGGVPPGPV
ncbi:MAG: FIG00841811: hypothetical protein, partial [uncultured Gemmatimonadaceae bacterium]